MGPEQQPTRITHPDAALNALNEKMTQPEAIWNYLKANEGTLCTSQELTACLNDCYLTRKRANKGSLQASIPWLKDPTSRSYRERAKDILSVSDLGYVLWPRDKPAPPKTFSDLNVSVFQEKGSDKKQVDGVSLLSPEVASDERLSCLLPLFDDLKKGRQENSLLPAMNEQQRRLLAYLVFNFEQFCPYLEVIKWLYPNDKVAFDSHDFTPAINSIREAFEEKGIDLRLYTVRGLGYLLSPPLDFEKNLTSLNIVSKDVIDSFPDSPLQPFSQEIARLCNLVSSGAQRDALTPLLTNNERYLLFFLAYRLDRYGSSRRTAEIIKRFWPSDSNDESDDDLLDESDDDLLIDYRKHIDDLVSKLKQKLELANSFLRINRLYSFSKDEGVYFFELGRR